MVYPERSRVTRINFTHLIPFYALILSKSITIVTVIKYLEKSCSAIGLIVDI